VTNPTYLWKITFKKCFISETSFWCCSKRRKATKPVWM